MGVRAMAQTKILTTAGLGCDRCAIFWKSYNLGLNSLVFMLINLTSGTDNLIEAKVYVLVVWLLAGSGFIVVFTSILGYIGLVCENRCLLGLVRL